MVLDHVRKLVDDVAWAVPVTLVLVGETLQTLLIGLIVAHRFSEDAFDGFTLANLSGNLIGMSVIAGVQSGMDTLIPIALGAGRLSEMGEVAQLGLVVSAGALLLFVPVWMQAETILRNLGQPAEICHFAGQYLSVSWIAVLMTLFFEAMRRFLNAQDVLWPFVYFRYTALTVQVVLALLLTGPLDVGFIGAAYAQIIGVSFGAITCALWVLIRRPHKEGSWPGWTRSAFEWVKVRRYLWLGLGGFFSFSEWWYWEALTFMAGWMGDDQQAAHACAYLVLPLAYIVPWGIGASLNYKMGQSLGRGDVDEAKALAFKCASAVFAMSVVFGVVQYVLKDPIMHTVKDLNPRIHHFIEQIWPWTALAIFIDTNYALINNVVKALGLQVKQAVLVFTTLWIIMVPTHYFVDFRSNGGLQWLWILFPIGEFVLLVGALLMSSLSDWHCLAVVARVDEEDTSNPSDNISRNTDAEEGMPINR